MSETEVADSITFDDIADALDEASEAAEKRNWAKLTAVSLWTIALEIGKVLQDRAPRE